MRQVLVARDRDAATRVLVVPVTHSAPDNLESTLEMPAAIKRHLDLDSDRSWVVLSEAMYSNGRGRIFAASVIATTVLSPTGFSRPAFSLNCAAIFLARNLGPITAGQADRMSRCPTKLEAIRRIAP